MNFKTVFDIQPDSINAENCSLICEISNDGFTYAILDAADKKFTGITVYHFDKNTFNKDYADVLNKVFEKQNVLSLKFKKVFVIYSFEESTLIPFALYSSSENENVLNLLNGDLQNDGLILTDIIAEKGIYNTYRIPISILKVFSSKFPDATNRHQYTLLLKQPDFEGDKLSVIFYPQRIVLHLIKNGRTQIINSFYYKTPEDVSYILLNTCKQYNAENVPIELSGLIEKDSVLYKEIYKYFENVSFATLSTDNKYTEEISQYPSHYFSHIFAVPSCE